ncbi:MAG: helix-turn-helix domain-containing protein [bacterium]|nr:helix-turn-helix domain-containing protein [bacterium]
MDIITAINTKHTSTRRYLKSDHQTNDIRQFGVVGLMATTHSCAYMRDIASSRNLAAGETLCWEDDPIQYTYLLIDGTMKAYKLLPNGRSQITRFMTSGEIISSPLIDNYSYSTEALGDCTILQLPQKRFDKIMAKDPALMKSVFEKLSIELQQAQKQILLLGRMPAIERVSNFLLDIAKRQNPQNPLLKADVLITLPMARVDIADYLGLTIETVSRAFSKFRRDGLIDLPRPNLVHLHDQTRLREQSRSLAD